MCLTEKVLRIYFEQNQLCIQVWRFTIGKFNRDVLVSNMKKKKVKFTEFHELHQSHKLPKLHQKGIK